MSTAADSSIATVAHWGMGKWENVAAGSNFYKLTSFFFFCYNASSSQKKFVQGWGHPGEAETEA